VSYIRMPGVDLIGVQADTLIAFNKMAIEYTTLTGKKIQVNSAYRDPIKQAQLYAADPVHNSAPGRSMHQYGYAFDIQSTDAESLEKSGLLKKYGFWRPLMRESVKNQEPWHIEKIGLNYDVVRRGSISLFTLLAVGVAVWLFNK